MEVKYDYSMLIELCDNMNNINYVESHVIDWDKLRREVIKSLIEKLFEFTSDEQRSAFLSYVLIYKIFSECNLQFLMLPDYVLGNDNPDFREQLAERILKERQSIKSEDEIYTEPLYTNFILNDKVWEFILEISSQLAFIVVELEEQCKVYKNLDFDEIVVKNLPVHILRHLRYEWFHDETGRYFPQGVRLKVIYNDEFLNEDPFISLFKKEYQPHIQLFTDILCQVTPPLISDAYEWLKPIGAAKVFADILKRKGIIQQKTTAEAIYDGFDAKFKTGRSFMRKAEEAKANDLTEDLEQRIDIILQNLGPSR